MLYCHSFSSLLPFVSPSADVLAAHDFNDTLGKDTFLLYGMTIHLPAEATKLGFIFVFLFEIYLFRYDETKLLSIMVMPPYGEHNLLCTEMISAYYNMLALGKEIVVPYADVIKIDGSLIRLDNKTISADDDVTLLPNDMTLPSAEVILPSGLLMTPSSLLVPFCVLLCPSVVVFL